MKKVRKIWVVAALVLLPVMSWAENKPENTPRNEVKIENTKQVQQIPCVLATKCSEWTDGWVYGYGEGVDQASACAEAYVSALAMCTVFALL